ncbi:hypothetical protein CYMTET_30112 [Cymbomonas tetramitiformis]|uniref:Uncharacterized protein n=1 Tax=Cymbomonas tetramitiformis TaxID=36881 RepID=A0AAE0KU83_9CHLO|nr:hypothetical protein CYMTET_30112 [Cymbomonas tetramitiformis]
MCTHIYARCLRSFSTFGRPDTAGEGLEIEHINVPDSAILEDLRKEKVTLEACSPQEEAHHPHGRMHQEAVYVLLAATETGSLVQLVQHTEQTHDAL